MNSSPQLFLAPSSISGVGVFSRKPIPAGAKVTVWDPSDCHFVPAAKAAAGEEYYFRTYCVETKGGYWCPLDFGRMSIGWYLNHAELPNLDSADGGTSYRAVRDIRAEEELTIDYRAQDKDVNNAP